jgi:hypothetical protein
MMTTHDKPSDRVERWRKASAALGSWMSAALDDPKVCDAMKADIREWFSAGEPFEGMADQQAEVERLTSHNQQKLVNIEALEQHVAKLTTRAEQAEAQLAAMQAALEG